MDTNTLLNQIERKFHLADDQEGAEMVYRLRRHIEKIRWSNRREAQKSDWLDTCLEEKEPPP